MRYPKKYTCKEWNRFSWDMQEKLCERYIVILTDYKTKKEKLFQVIDKINVKNLNAGITKFNKGVNSFTKSIESTNKSKGPSLKGLLNNVTMSQREYDSILGKPRKIKGNTMSFWGEDAPTRKKRNKRAKSVQKKSISFYGEKKMKFF